MGEIRALVLSVGANVIWLAPIGLLVGTFACRRAAVALLYVCLCVFVVLLALSGAGFSLRYLPIVPLVTAMLLYAIPFSFVLRAVAAAVPPRT